MKSPRNKNRTRILILSVAIIFLAIFVILEPSEGQIERLNAFIGSYHALAPLIVIGLIVSEVIIAPLPGYFIPVASGLFFGPLLGFLYAWIGNVIGSILAFVLSRFIRSSILVRLVSKKKLGYYHTVLTSSESLLWLFYIFPIFPIDIISFAAGFTNMRLRKFMKIVIFGFIPNMLILSFFGGAIVEASRAQKVGIAVLFLFILVVSIVIEERIRKSSESTQADIEQPKKVQL